MGLLDTMIDKETALLANIEKEIVVSEVTLGKESGFSRKHKVFFNEPRTVDYRANIPDIITSLSLLMNNEKLRHDLGKKAREHVVANFDYKVVASKFVKIIQDKLGIV